MLVRAKGTHATIKTASGQRPAGDGNDNGIHQVRDVRAAQLPQKRDEGSRRRTPLRQDDHRSARDDSASNSRPATAKGARFQVTMSSRTAVQVPRPHQVSQLRIGVATIAVGHVTAEGTLSAQAVLQLPPGWGNLRVGSCSPTSINSAITTAITLQE